MHISSGMTLETINTTTDDPDVVEVSPKEPSESESCQTPAAPASNGQDGDGPPFVYSREFLLQLRAAPLSSAKVEILERLEEVGLQCLRAVKKKKPQKSGSQKTGGGGDARHSENDKVSSGTGGNSQSSANTHGKKHMDARDRVRCEEDGIVLSPQRRSFVTGCHAPSIKLKPDNETERESHQSVGRRMTAAGSRAVINTAAVSSQSRDDGSSGRVVTTGVNSGASGGNMAATSGGHRQFDHHRYEHRYDDKVRHDRRSTSNNNNNNNNNSGGGAFSRGEPSWMSGGGGGGGYRGQQQRRSGGGGGGRRYDTERQPEWFSDGPTSQLEMIELSGFDGAVDEPPPPPPVSAADIKNNQPAAAAAADVTAGVVTGLQKKAVGGALDDDPAIESTVQRNNKNNNSSTSITGLKPSLSSPLLDLDLDHILSADLTTLDAGGGGAGGGRVGGSDGGGGSRFSRWFQSSGRSASPAAVQSSQTAGVGGGGQCADIASEMVGNILNGIDGLSVHPAVENDSFFAPISPVGGAATRNVPSGVIGGATAQPSAPSGGQIQQHALDSAVLSAKLAGISGRPHNTGPVIVSSSSAATTSSSNISVSTARPGHMTASSCTVKTSSAPPNVTDAFRQLVCQLRESEQQQQTNVVSQHQHHQQQQQQHSSVLGRSLQAPSGERSVNQPGAVAQNNIMRLLHVQQQQQQNMAAAPLAGGMMGVDQQSLLSSVDARNMMAALHTGRITRQYLIQQLHSQNLPMRTREIILTVLRLPHSQQQQPQQLPRPPSAAVEHTLMQQQQQQRHLSALGRTISPLVAPPHYPHQMGVRPGVLPPPALQQALIKQQQQQRQRKMDVKPGMPEHHPHDGRRAVVAAAPVGANLSASLAFTPTAVLRNVQHQQQARCATDVNRPTTGRYIVKTSVNGPTALAPSVLSGGGGTISSAVGRQMAPPIGNNPLLRWFSPEVLAAAATPQSAELPASSAARLPGVLSVQELEQRHGMR